MRRALGSRLHFLQDNWMTLVILGAFAIMWLLLHSSSTTLGSPEDFDQRVRAGKPVIVEVFSNT